ncbi:nodulation protein NodH [Thalassobius vesicularis]|uniref:Nodulation protein NodH n=1 Tax=Thalassobius vesicularis TaxID=1294297 RepID=A0A4S3MB51_9RHOB|nr:nodulation protein NodH [Thalassobius vesicularis]THD73736.1 nodulation protein NodH [Thalassobius vesicularis]
MTRKFDYFVMFAEMRTGSNFLETNLNAYPGLFCHGEAFNPHFIGYPNRDALLGFTQSQRESDPFQLLQAVRDQQEGLHGFRYFHDHDPRILDTMLNDPRCAKIVLTRNPAESYVSWKIAQSTGQWKLTNVKRRKGGTAVYSDQEFEAHLAALQGFQLKILNALQVSGQTAFYLDYEDLQDLGVINGLANWLGIDERLDGLDESLKKQNPEPLAEKVENFGEMERALSGLDRFNLTRTPNFEPRRGAAVPGYIACAQSALLYMPVPGGPVPQVAQWMADLDGGQDVQDGFTQKTLRQWRSDHAGFRSFTVLRHPVARAHHVFCSRILNDGPGSFPRIRKMLCHLYGLPLPQSGIPDGYDAARHREAFLAFLSFVQDNLQGQTSSRLDPNWASQSEILAGFAGIGQPDFVLREGEMPQMLPLLAAQVRRADAPTPAMAGADEPFALAEIYDEEVEAKARSAYSRDYLRFGFGDWSDQAA